MNSICLSSNLRIRPTISCRVLTGTSSERRTVIIPFGITHGSSHTFGLWKQLSEKCVDGNDVVFVSVSSHLCLQVGK